MEKLYINGGKKLSGDLEISSSKNAMLPILAGCIISGKTSVVNNIALFTDVHYMTKILESLGCNIKIFDNKIVVDSSTANNYEIKDQFTKKIRSSIFMLGPLLSRFKKAKVAYPGGCNIGNRPIDLHIKGLKGLNVKIEEKHGYIFCDGSDMRAGEIHLDFPSVGATENLMMASVNLQGVTQIYNCAREPEIEDLANYLNSIGCKVYGAGSSTITIIGVQQFVESSYTPIGDRIIAGSYLIACAMCGGNIHLTNVKKEHNLALINKLEQSGVMVNCGKNYMDIVSNIRPKSINILDTQPYPGFPTDLQNQMLTMECISNGTCVVVENLYESRFKICSELTKMGADITVKDRMAIIKGVDVLYGAEVTATDLRGGAGLVLAGLVADGYTTIEDIYHIDRGYLEIEKDLCSLGAEIRRIND